MAVYDILAEGDLVVIAWSGGGTHPGDLMGIPPSGKQGFMAGITVNRIHQNFLSRRSDPQEKPHRLTGWVQGLRIRDQAS